MELYNIKCYERNLECLWVRTLTELTGSTIEPAAVATCGINVTQDATER